MIQILAPTPPVTPPTDLERVPACDAIDFGLTCDQAATSIATTTCCGETAQCCPAHRFITTYNGRRDVICGVCKTPGRLGRLIRFDLLARTERHA